MPFYSHSQLSTYEECPLKYRLNYRDRIKRDVEGVEAFLGTMVHETLKKCYDDVRLTKLNSLPDLLSYLDIETTGLSCLLPMMLLCTRNLSR